jgi:DNA polymerase III epsilon subunit family exonuclease
MPFNKQGIMTSKRSRLAGLLVLAIVPVVLLLYVAVAAGQPGRATPGASSSRLPPKNMLVSNVTFVVFDTETTGFSPTTDRIVEVGAVKFRNGRVIEEKSWLVNPGRKIPYYAWRVHGISDDMVKDARPFKSFYPEFQDFIEGSVLMAHNARFDVSFLSAELKRNDQSLPRNLVIDSLSLFRQWYPNAKSFTLADIAVTAKIETKVLHRALADSMYVFLIFDKGLKDHESAAHLRDIYDQCGGPLRF